MDLKLNNIEFDPDIILSHGLRILTLESENDIFECSDQFFKKEIDSDSENGLSSEDKVHKSQDDPDESVSKFTANVKKPEINNTEMKTEARSRLQKRKKDINGNDNYVSVENLNCMIKDWSLADDSVFSDSDNETNKDSVQSNLKARAPMRARRRANKSKDYCNILGRNESNDPSQFDNERLRFKSGSSYVQFSYSSLVTPFTYNEDLSLDLNKSDSLIALTNQDSLFEDIRASGVSSPESGYDSSIPGSPSKVSGLLSLSLDNIPETDDEQIFLDSLADYTVDCALPDFPVPSRDSESKDDIINDLVNYLKDTPDQAGELVEAAIEPLSMNIRELVPSVSNVPDFNSLPVLLPAVTTKASPKSSDMPKKIVSKKLNDSAKKALKGFLSRDKFFATAKKIYKKIQEDKGNNREIEIIYVVDETDKASKYQTNLHHAVLNSEIEDVFCLVEIQKQYDKPLKDINMRDRLGKTALDYAIEQKMSIVIDYLRENTACESVNI